MHRALCRLPSVIQHGLGLFDHRQSVTRQLCTHAVNRATRVVNVTYPRVRQACHYGTSCTSWSVTVWDIDQPGFNTNRLQNKNGKLGSAGQAAELWTLCFL